MPNLFPLNRVSNEHQKRNYFLGYRGEDEDHCILCNRRVNPKTAWYVIPSQCFTLVVSKKKADTISPEQMDGMENLHVDGQIIRLQGFFSIGSTCAKTIPRKFRWR